MIEVRARFSLDVTGTYNEDTDDAPVLAPLAEEITYGGAESDYSIYTIIAAYEQAVKAFEQYLAATLE